MNNQSVRDYIELKLEELKKLKKFKLEVELWNTMYNLSAKYGVSVGDDINDLSESCKRYLEIHLNNIYNYFPNKKLGKLIKFKTRWDDETLYYLKKINDKQYECFREGYENKSQKCIHLKRDVKYQIKSGNWIIL